MTQAEQADACRHLKEALLNISSTCNTVATPLKEVIRSLENAEFSTDDDHALSLALFQIALHAHQVCNLVTDNVYCSDLFTALADATRSKPIWRSWFGAHQLTDRESIMCVLDVAQDLIARAQQPLVSQHLLSSLRSALRLIANCCADNNVNRRHFLLRNGVQSLFNMLIGSIELNFVIPAIYNVCSNYEDPDPLVYEQNADDPSNEATPISFAIQQLAAASDQQADFATFELLLAVSSGVSEDRLGFLAELVEMAALPATTDLRNVLGSRTGHWQWSFKHSHNIMPTLGAANELAQNGLECRISVLRAILYVLSQEEARRELLKKHDDSVLQLIQLAMFQPNLGDEDLEDWEEEIKACRKEFSQIFYQLTGMIELIEDQEASELLLGKCLSTLRASNILPQPGANATDQNGANILLITDKSSTVVMGNLIILAQLCASEKLRDITLDFNDLIEALAVIIRESTDPEILYPTVTLISRLALSSKEPQPLITIPILQGMRRLLTAGGLGLAIPFETVNALRLLLKGRPAILPLYLQGNPDDSIIATLVTLFNRTIEAGTKLEVGQFFIELLRTLFPYVKDMDQAGNDNGKDAYILSFRTLLSEYSGQIGQILTFVCVEAEPKDHRVHGWFGLGMLSVWSQGQSAITNSIEHHDLGQAILKVSQTDGGPAVQNLKLILSKMQTYTEGSMSKEAKECLKSAANNLGMVFAIQ